MNEQFKTIAIGNNAFSIRIQKGVMTGIKYTHDTIDTQYILPGAGFGDLQLFWRDEGSTQWNETSTAGRAEEGSFTELLDGAGGYSASYTESGLSVEVGYRLEAETLIYSIQLRNNSLEGMEIGDLILPFPMNSAYEWGKDPNLSVFRHSFISGQGSYMFWMRSNSVGPYLAMFPVNGSHFEYFDMRHIEIAGKKHGIFRAYIHSAHDYAIAREKGCRWRQPSTSLMLGASESIKYEYKFIWVTDYEGMRASIVREGLVDVRVMPGMTLPQSQTALLRLRCRRGIDEVAAEFPGDTIIETVKQEGADTIYRITFKKLGENLLNISFGGGKHMTLEFFCCQAIETLINKRGAFIAECQHRNTGKWYEGLISEWNMETGILLGPDNYDRIRGWRIYEVTCDDPGLCKPAFLAAKNAEYPVQDEIEALDYYIQHFVWGGLQRTDEEEYSYGIYGIPDWHKLRNSEDPGIRGKLHIWRIYDYPHLALMYFSMYRIARDHSHIKMAYTKELYLERAYRTALAMFTIPEETDEWSAYKTGLYNELVFVDIFKELYATGQKEKALRLEMHWLRKARFFINDKPDLFGSEYPFDSTGFESTYALAKYALTKPVEEENSKSGILPDKAYRFLNAQHMGNIFCRGWLEPAYYLYGSDYRGCGSAAYTLSYMAQMGGWAVLDYALNYASDPNEWLPLGYASILSSWALMNAGTEESNYGYWYPGIENDGAAGGGFEPAPYGETWLEQPHHRGNWYYACEIDLGFSGALRGARTILARDPEFGLVCYGGQVFESDDEYKIDLKDGLGRRFSAILDGLRLHIELDGARIANGCQLFLKKDFKTIKFIAETACSSGGIFAIHIEGIPRNRYIFKVGGVERCSFVDGLLDFNIETDSQKIELEISA